MNGGWRQWLAFGSGVGIEIGPDDLEVTVTRVRPSGARIIASTTIERFRERPAGEWGAEYAQFLRKTRTPHLAAVAVLPRGEMTVRSLTLPGVADRDLAAAIGFQLDSLHPYPEAEVLYGWARLPGTAALLAGITRTSVIERYAALFAEAGIRLSGFSFSAAVMYAAIRLLGVPPAGGFLAVHSSAGGTELYGESASRPVLSATFENGPERAVALAASELRLQPETEPRAMAALLPPAAAPDGYDPTRAPFARAAALAAACPHLALPANLLPEAQRTTSSRVALVPTAALALLLAAAGAVLASYDSIEDRRYLASLEAEMRALQSQAVRVQQMDRSAEKMLARMALLDEFRGRSQADLNATQELTRLLAPPAWLQGMHLTRATVALQGEAEQSAALLKLIDGSALFQNSEFTQAISRTGAGESFGIRAAREGVRP